MMGVLREIARAIAERRRLWLGIALGIFAGYYLALLLAAIARFGSWPNYAHVHDFMGGIGLILAGTSHPGDILDLVAEEILIEVGYMHPTFGLAEWSVNFIPVKALLVLALGALVATFAALALRPRGAACAPRAGRTAAAAGLGSALIALSSATLTWVVCCSTPTWVVGLAMMGLGVSTSLALEPLGTWIGAAGLLLLGAGILVQARRRVRSQRGAARAQLVGSHA